MQLTKIPSKFMLGYLVLNCSKAPVLPFMPGGASNQHISGSSNGIVACLSTQVQPAFEPQRGRQYFMYSTSGYPPDTLAGMPLLKRFCALHSEQELDLTLQSAVGEVLLPSVIENSMVFIEQRSPFGLGIFLTKGVDLFMYGLYSEHQSLLVWTNSSSYEDDLLREYGNQFWIFRFLPRRDVSAVMFTKRLCSRWYRWSQQSDFKTPAARFPALERILFRREFT